MKISKNKVVSISYVLREDTADGEIIEIADAQKPFTFLYGVGSLLPLFEENLNGLSAGDTFSFRIPSDEGYGEYDEEAVVEIAKEAFVLEGKSADEWVQIGTTIPMQNEEGEVMQGIVIELTNQGVVLDFNHPMAGIDLYFSGEVLQVRDASASELAHGHVHDGNGHHHDH